MDKRYTDVQIHYLHSIIVIFYYISIYYLPICISKFVHISYYHFHKVKRIFIYIGLSDLVLHLIYELWKFNCCPVMINLDYRMKWGFVFNCENLVYQIEKALKKSRQHVAIVIVFDDIVQGHYTTI